MKFHKDVVVDLVCYRRLGHNEQDEPMVTQPLMYKTHRQAADDAQALRRPARAGGRHHARADGDEMVATFRKALDGGYHTNKTILSNYKPPFEIDWSRTRAASGTSTTTRACRSRRCKRSASASPTVPENFKLHPRVEKIIDDRRLMAQGKLPLDWGMAEHLAYATLLNEGYSIRLSGQDSGRGTFFHRHAVLHDQNRERWDQGTYVPLQHVSEKQGDFVVIDSLLSEEAVLGFEYGYATSGPTSS